MLPVIALVGRPNVGKSTLFNILTRSRDALVADVPGLTRDRQYGFGKVGPRPYLVVDTGGLSGDLDGLDGLMARQTLAALQEADLVLFLVDAREGLTAADDQVTDILRRSGKPVRLLVNKAEGLDPDLAVADFHALALGEPVAVSSAHGDNIAALMDAVAEGFAEQTDEPSVSDTAVRVAVIGRPNVGKSTLINRLLGEDRLVAYDQPGTTRDSVYVPFERGGRQYTLIDTAGVRRRARVSEVIEKFSVIKTLKAIDDANVVVFLLDGSEGVSDQDASLLGLTLQRGRALVVAVNKWDGLSRDQRQAVRRHIDVKLPFLDFATMHFISALHGSGLGDVMASVDAAFAAATRDLPTPELTRVLQQAVTEHQPPLVRGRRPRLRYAHQGGRNPPVIVVHGNQTSRLPESYRRYLTNRFRKAFKLDGTPVRVELKSGSNPFAGRRNKLSSRQQARKKRLLKHVKKRK